MRASFVPGVRRVELVGERSLAGGVLRVAGPLPGPVPVVDIEAVGDPADADADVVVELRDDWIAPFQPGGLAPGGGDIDETYIVDVRDGRLHIAAGTPAGAYRGLTAVAHGVDRDAGTVALFTATDGPAWRWRGLSFDAVRHSYTLDELRQVVDLLAWHRFSVLHLHLTDSQAWRLQMPGYPALTPADRISYSPDDLRAFGAYAAERHITVIPEVDLPGHTHAALRAYPELVGPEPPAHPWLAHLRPNHEPAMRFAQNAIEALCGLLPGPYVHIGGDEAFGMDAAEYAEFIATATDWVRAAGKRPIGWQEVGRSPGAMGPGDVIQMWIGVGDAFTPDQIDQLAERYPFLRAPFEEMADGAVTDPAAARDSGAHLIVSSTNPLYLDRRYLEPSIDPAQNDAMERLGMSYPPKSTRELYATEPPVVADAAGLPGRIAGFEAAIWAESIESMDDLATLLLPRLAMFAERMWAPEPLPWDELAPRLAAHAPAWSVLGFPAFYRSSEIFG